MNTTQDDNLILAVNSGSSSLKLGFFEKSGNEQEVLRGTAHNIGRADGTLRLESPGGSILLERNVCESQEDALRELMQSSLQHLGRKPVAVGHRVVHGGPVLIQHQLVTPSVLEQLKAAEHFAPLHIPQSLKLVEDTNALLPGIPTYVCFDTAFHRTLPEEARRFALPATLVGEEIHRYGFHGLSYESIVHRLGNGIPARVVIAHLGNGSSLCALRRGTSIDTTMGLTPTGGIPMSTRSGDLDPGVLLFLLRTGHIGIEALEDVLNHNSGIRALSGGEADMRALLASAQAGDKDATLALKVYTTAIRKTIGAYAALLGGIDMLVFAGGIGENSPEIRSQICDGLEFLRLSPNSCADRVRVIRSEEERQIARICRSMLGPPTPRPSDNRRKMRTEADS